MVNDNIKHYKTEILRLFIVLYPLFSRDKQNKISIIQEIVL